jgi:hypothetical protein
VVDGAAAASVVEGEGDAAVDAGATAGVSSEPDEHDINVSTPTTPMITDSRGFRIE